MSVWKSSRSAQWRSRRLKRAAEAHCDASGETTIMRAERRVLISCPDTERRLGRLRARKKIRRGSRRLAARYSAPQIHLHRVRWRRSREEVRL